MKAKFAPFLVLLLLPGCAGTNNKIVQAAGPTQFPAVPPAGGTIKMEPGTYTCPDSIASGTHIIGHGAIVPPELLASTNFAPIASTGTGPVVRVVCTHNLTIKNVHDVQMSGVIFDFQGSGAGLILDGVTYSRFDIGIFDAGTALTLTTHNGNTFSDMFPRLVLYKHDIGIVFDGINSKAVTWNDFGPVDLVDTRQVGIVVSQYADTNTFAAVRMHLLGSAQDGLVFNDAGTLRDVDASGNVFQLVNCDAEAGFAGSCAHFKGYSVGNFVRMGFGIMPDQSKVRFDNPFSAASNTIQKMQEQPKLP
jgi:hypothetical protein